MIVVIVAAKKQNKDFISELVRLLEKHFITVRAYGGVLSVKKSNPAMIICDTQSFDTVKAENAIVIYKDILPIPQRLLDIRHGVAIVDSSNYQLSQALSDTGLPAITCGLHSRDTITLTSMGVDSAVIGIQRAIVNFDGSITEPQELPINFTKSIDRFTLMTAAAILILSGNSHLLKGKM